MNKFPCTACGLCCVHAAGNIAEAKEFGLEGYEEFPYAMDENGTCEMYDPKTRLCKVYDHRPEICHVDAVLKKYPQIDREIYYKLVASVCNAYIDKDGLDEKYKITI